MKYVFALLFGFGITTTTFASVAFEASLSDIQADHAACDALFAVQEYHVSHHWVGPTRRTSVMHLRAAEGVEEIAFFHNKNWVGLYGPDGDLYYEEEYILGDQMVDFLAQGFLDYNVMYLELEAVVTDPDGEVCVGTAVLAGFN
jgi:hypothetical protein